jgi:Tol biopolymer transport system component
MTLSRSLGVAALIVLATTCTLEPDPLLPPRPPGHPVAYVTQGEAGIEDIFVLSADADSDENVTRFAAYDAWPSWSPDGTQMAFESNRNETRTNQVEIYVLTLGSPAVQRLTNDSTFTSAQPAWSPLGNRIAFATNRDTVGFNGDLDIYLMSPNGADTVRLTPDTTNETQPAWSPDGALIAFVTDKNGPNGEIYVMDSTGGNVVNLTNNAASDLAPAWSPDGAKIAFMSNRDGVGFAIWVMNANGSNPVKVSGSSPDCELPSWTPDGLRLGFDCDSDLWFANADGTGLTQITRTSYQQRVEIMARWKPVP